MKTYKHLLDSLPPKTTVFAIGSFCPPTLKHQVLVQVVDKLAEQYKANHVIFVTKDTKSLLEDSRKLYHLNQLFPKTQFILSSALPNEIIKSLHETQRNLVYVTDSNLTQKKLVEQYNGKVFSINNLNLRANSADLQALASKGLFEEFKSGLPSNTRSIDARRLMNDLRESIGLQSIKPIINISTNVLREKYFNKEIFNIGDIVEYADQKLEIIKRGTNYVICKDDNGITTTKWLHEVSAT